MRPVLRRTLLVVGAGGTGMAQARPANPAAVARTSGGIAAFQLASAAIGAGGGACH